MNTGRLHERICAPYGSFSGQTLGWTIPRPRTPEQADRWTWLVPAAYTQLRLTRQLAGDQRLPWERPRPQPRLSPLRVRRGFPRLLCALGSPASTPKPFGRSPGRPRGRCSGPATRYPAIKKPATKPRKKPSKTTKPPERLTIGTKRRDLGRRPTRHARRVKSQAKGGGRREFPHATSATTFPLAWPCSR